MQKTLLRQLKRSLGIASEGELADLLNAMQAAATTADPALRRALEGFGEFLTRVDGSYEQYERDLDLRTRSLEISSSELSDSNEKLRLSLAGRENALRSLRKTVRHLLPDDDQGEHDATFADEDIAELSKRIASMVAESEHGRRELATQKFALDQHAIVSITDTAGTILYANDRFCQISGYSREELLGRNHRIVNSGTHSPEMFRDMWHTISLGQVWHGEVCNRARSGNLYWVSATIVPLLNADGEPERHIAIRTDITDRKRIEAQLSEQLHLVEELIEAIPLPVYLKDGEGRYLRLNRAFELFFHIKREAIIGHTLHDLLPPEDASLHTEKDAELFASKGMQSYEATVHSRDGVIHETVYRKAALTRRDGSVSGLLGVIVDITERKQAEIEVLRAKEAAEAASQAKSDFLANMSHEIRTPMNGVIGMTDLALETALTAEQRDYLNIAKSSAESLLTIINDILDFSKIEAGKLHVEEISFDLYSLISEVLKPLALRAHEKGIELLSEVLHDVPRYVKGDPSRIRQVLVNLVGNAIKFTQHGEIALRTELLQLQLGQATIHFSVRDTGIGIAPEKQELIFDAFSQEDSSTTRKYGGTGLGLSICRRLVELMGGRMWLQSEIGNGSTFHFSVQLLLSAPATPSVGSEIDLTGRQILVVDDNATNRRILNSMLGLLKTSPRDVDSAQAALTLLQEGNTTFDCILLDAQMPEMDGYELARRLRQTVPNLPPMLMLSSGALRGDAQRCQEAGIAGFFSKPISLDELHAALGRLFDNTPTANTPAAKPLVTRHSLRERRRPLNILLVEDHPTNQKLTLGLLGKWGHETTLAQNGLEALDLLEHRTFDVILMDMQMPIMGGIEATERIRAREAEFKLTPVPIIAMTAAAMQDDRDACLAAGMDDYLSKPIRVKELQEKLDSVIGNH
ncbi:MAG: response regulator [Gammaproteobacteria bacterium]|nr:response regulator [Gammaproteobacteria bacterium]MBU1600864.1 response regulator [Gammaproteobacteria bacterium]MBU2435320.1 response regulator [Gammaproteobacteria bacterium]MBU2448734.1 response regulator [Gammaproteobacteria bacterium]